MSNENGSSVASVIDLGPHGPPFASVNRQMSAMARSFASRRGGAAQRVAVGTATAAQVPARVRLDDALPHSDFLRDLQREKRRAERSQAALSLVLYRVADKAANDPPHANRLLELLQSAKRETDTLGNMGDNMIAVLCPDTDEQGAKSFMRKIEASAGNLPFTAVASTYPDDLVENLAKGTHIQPAVKPYLVADGVGHKTSAYALKRGLDIAGALFALCIFGPLMLLVAAAIALTSRGPIIFRQTRLGKAGVPFTFYKFRSMVVNGNDAIHRAFVANLIKGEQAQGTAADGETASYKLKADPRITRIGGFIRKTSIDELPQFFNVLKGDMSLVGPRPPIPYEAAEYQPWHLRRVISVKPGITGLWQVEGRSKVTFNDMVRMDLRYIRNCSLALDLKILLKTVLVVVRCDGAR